MRTSTIISDDRVPYNRQPGRKARVILLDMIVAHDHVIVFAPFTGWGALGILDSK